MNKKDIKKKENKVMQALAPLSIINLERINVINANEKKTNNTDKDQF